MKKIILISVFSIMLALACKNKEAQTSISEMNALTDSVPLNTMDSAQTATTDTLSNKEEDKDEKDEKDEKED